MECSNILLAKTEVTARFTCTAEWSVAEDLEMFSKSNILTFDVTSNRSIIARDVEAVIFQQLPLPLPFPHLSLPLPLTKSDKTIVDNFFYFCGSVACLLLHFIILRRQKPSFIAITLPTSLELIVLNYSVLFFIS